jgi:hypothetical protein
VVKERLAEEVVEQVDLGFVRLEYVPVVAERAEHDLVRLMAGLERIEDEQSGERRLTDARRAGDDADRFALQDRSCLLESLRLHVRRQHASDVRQQSCTPLVRACAKCAS